MPASSVHCAARPVSAVVFDFFGTLTTAVSRGPRHADIARGLGCDPDAFLAVLDRSLRARWRGLFGTPEATLRWVCDQLGVDPPPERLRWVLRQRVAAIAADIRLRPDAAAALAAVRARGLATAVISDCGFELPALWPRLPIAPLVDACVFSVEVGECKPHPALYRTACERLGAEPGACLYIGDGGGRELTGARAAGMQPVRLAAPDLAGHLVFDPDREFTGPTAASLGEAVTYLDLFAAAAPFEGSGAVPVEAPAATPVPRQAAPAVPSRP